MGVGLALKWKRDELRAAFSRLKLAAIGGVVGAIVIMGLTFGHNILTAFFMAVAIWIIVGSMLLLAQRVRLGFAPFSTSLKLIGTTPRAFYGLVIAHAGIGILVAGIAGMSTWATEKLDLIRPGQAIALSGYDLRLLSIDDVQGPNY